MKDRFFVFAVIFSFMLTALLTVSTAVFAQSNDYWRQQQQQQQMMQEQQRRWQQQQDDMRRQQEQMRQQQLQEQQRQQQQAQQRQLQEQQRQQQQAQQRQLQERQQQQQQAQQRQLQERQQQQQQAQQRQLQERQQQNQQRIQQQTVIQQRQQLRQQGQLGTAQSTQIMKAPRNPTPGELQRGFTGKVTADGRALVRFQDRILTVPASRISGLSARLAVEKQRKINWTTQQQITINERVKAIASNSTAKAIDKNPVKDKNPIIITSGGVALPPEILARQGKSTRVGDFRGLEGASVDEIVARVPNDWKIVPQDRGTGIKFIDTQGYERIRIHGPSTNAPVGSNSASGWTIRIMDQAGNYYDNIGNVVPYRDNSGHIPIHGNPVLRDK